MIGDLFVKFLKKMVKVDRN